MQSRHGGSVVPALFFCSGATALVYEVVWSKFLSQSFGNTVYAQTVVLAIFMGGLALGNRVFGKRADRMQRPVRMYGILEICIGIYGLIFPLLDRIADELFVALGTPIAERSGLLLCLKGILSLALLLGPTLLMGGTLPLLAAWLKHSSPDAGKRSARFYAINTFGAVVGAGIAGFWLIQHWGMIGTLVATAIVNVAIGFAAVLIQGPSPANETVADSDSARTTESATPATLRWAGVIVAITGGVSLGLELLASRSLALIFGSSVQSFAVVLMAFILGIGLGSAWIASARSKSSENVIIVLLCIASTWVAFLVFNIEQWVNLYRLLRIGLAHNNVGYLYNLGATTLISLLVLGFPAACIGAVLPVMIRTFSYVNERFGERVGWLLTWNTLGGVTGTLVTGFLLMPGVGLRNAFGVLASILAVVSFILAFQKSWRFRLLIPIAATAVSVSLFFCGGAGWREVMSSGIFRVRETTYTPNLMQIRKQQMKLLFYEDAPDATVSVELAGGIVTPQSIGLRINGKADAGTDIDVCNQLLLAHLPMLVKPEAKDVFVLGLGSGMTAGAVLAYPVNQVVVAENCDPVIRAARLFGDWNRHVLDHPKTHLRREDARTVLKLSPQLYDVIITEPSNPWTIGVGSVFNRDFYELAAKRLKPRGMVAQWFHLYETEDDIVALVLRTFGSVFPYIEIWDTGIGDMVILGSMEPWETGPGVMQSGFNIERVRTDMLMIDIKSSEVLMARQLASQRTGFAIANPGPIQSDLHPLVEYTGPAALFRGDRAAMLDRYDERTHQQLLAPLEKRILLAKLQPVPTQTMFGTFSTMNGEVYGCLFGTSLGAGVPCALQTPNQQPTPDSDDSLLSQAKQLFAAGRFAEAANVTSFVLQQDPKNREASYLARIIDREKGIRN